MPTFSHGKDAVVLLDNTNLSTTLTDVAVSLTADVNETSTFSSSAKSFISGLTDGTATASGYFTTSSPDSNTEYLAQLGSSGSAFSIAPIGYTRGNPATLGKVIETSYDRSADVAGVVAVAVAFQFSDDSFDGKSLVAPAAFTTTSTETSVDFGAAGTNGGGAVLHVTAASGTSPTLDAKIQTSADNASFSDYITFSQKTAVGSEYKTSTSNPARYARAVLTIGGSTPSFTVAISFGQG
jgi:hypothetical protein|tara:strand:- start:279 stop:995 length:717 start_codon:yes stop_codon:yes gene_type:complete